jgi:hypothetical protein
LDGVVEKMIRFKWDERRILGGLKAYLRRSRTIPIAILAECPCVATALKISFKILYLKN